MSDTATRLPWFRALHSYACGWWAVQPEEVREHTSARFVTCEAFLGALLTGDLGLQFDTDDDAITTVYLTVADDEGTAHIMGGVLAPALGLPSADHVARALAAAGWSLNPPAAAPDDLSGLGDVG